VADHELGESDRTAKRFEKFAEESFSLEIDARRRFVQNQKFRFALERERKEDSLQFSSGKGAESPVFEAFGIDKAQPFSRFRPNRFPDSEPKGRPLFSHGEKFRDGDGHPSIEGKALRDVADPGLSGTFPVSESNVAPKWNLPQKRQKERCLSGTIRTDDRRASSGRNRGSDILKDRNPAQCNGQTFELNREFQRSLQFREFPVRDSIASGHRSFQLTVCDPWMFADPYLFPGRGRPASTAFGRN
jgi:hypothetical protein